MADSAQRTVFSTNFHLLTYKPVFKILDTVLHLTVFVKRTVFYLGSIYTRKVVFFGRWVRAKFTLLKVLAVVYPITR